MSVTTEIDLDLAPLNNVLIARTNICANDLCPILQEVQAVYGYLPSEILMVLSQRTGIPASQIYGVATFYEQFHLEPQGRHTIRCCRGTACHVRGGHGMIQEVSRVLGISEGQTTEDMRFTFETVACLGTCFLAPVIMVDDDYYGNVKASTINGIVQRYK